MAEPGRRFPSPNEFYKARRPERFSDSVLVDKPSLNRSQLEYFLGSLTSRSQEVAFENFARGLAERRIAPNLLPHTGPTGGGDSKVDSETFPVADALALGWFQGIGRDASKERWAFAFSAKQDWKSKLESDIDKIVNTGRGYAKAFFITSQFVRDKDRADLEDKLSAEHGIDVRILDRNWLLDTVFDGQLENFAIDALGLSPEIKTETRRGPRDTERLQRLEELEVRINESLNAGQTDVRVIIDALRSATTARGLERPRVDIDGRFLRARELAERIQLRSELIKIIYQWAWTSFFWYEDYGRFAALSREALELAVDSNNAHELELVTRLFSLIESAIAQGSLSSAELDREKFGQELLAALHRVAAKEENPSNALHAQTLALQVQLLTAPENADSLLGDLGRVIERAQSMIGYPFEQTAELVGILQDAFGEREAYSTLFERVVEIAGKRKGDVTAAQMLLKRGAQQLERGHHLEAIRNIGRALGRLYKNETRGAVTRGLLLAGLGYWQADLLWAARGTVIVAASLATHDLYAFGRVTRLQAMAYDQLRWIELQLGRLPQALEWHRLAATAKAFFAASNESAAFDEFDAVLGIAFLRSGISELRLLERLPDMLEELGLYMAKSALLFALGHPSDVPDETLGEGSRDAAEFEFMRQWRDKQLPEKFRPQSLGQDEFVIIESDILGCHVEVTAENKSPAFDLAEVVLASLESLLSTALDSHMMAWEPVLKIRVVVSEFAESPFSSRLQYERGRPHIHIACRPFNPHVLNHEEQAEIKNGLTNLLIETFAHIVVMPDDSQSIDQLFGSENALQRSVDFTNTFVSLGNVLGHNPKTRLDELIKPDAHTYEFTRDGVWDADERGDRAPEVGSQPSVKYGDSKERPEFPAPRRHTQVRTISLIRQKLWNDAGWAGVGYFGWLGEGAPPLVMALLFRNAKAATEIFQGLLEDLGDEDIREALRISIIRGISSSNPAYYRVVIGTEPAEFVGKIKPMHGRALMISRVHTMTPPTTDNLDRFLESYRSCNSFLLAPGVVELGGDPKVADLRLRKRTIHVRNAWQIGRHDPDVPAILAADDVIMPNDVADPPVKELLRWLKDR